LTGLLNFGKPNIELPKTHLDGLNFSFSGIKTAVLNINHNKKDIKKEDLCASFEQEVTDMLIKNTKKAVEMTGLKKIVLAGGVSANSYIRERFKLCTDNAAMIAAAGYYDFIAGKRADLTLNAVPNLKLE